MVVTTRHITQLREGATAAHAAKIHRLGHALTALADVTQAVHDGSDDDAMMLLPEAIEKFTAVARSLARTVEANTAAERVA